MRPDDAIVFWDGEIKELADGLNLIRCGGHFKGGTVLHWAGGAEGRGALLSGDIIQVVADRKHVSFMYSYPNHILLAAPAIERIVKSVEPFPYERVYQPVDSAESREAVTVPYLCPIGRRHTILCDVANLKNACFVASAMGCDAMRWCCFASCSAL